MTGTSQHQDPPRTGLWPALWAIAAFVAVFALMAPASCTTTPDVEGKKILEICRSVAGVPYGGSTVADFVPALVFAASASIPLAFGVRNVLRRRRRVTAPD